MLRGVDQGVFDLSHPQQTYCMRQRGREMCILVRKTGHETLLVKQAASISQSCVAAHRVRWCLKHDVLLHNCSHGFITDFLFIIYLWLSQQSSFLTIYILVKIIAARFWVAVASGPVFVVLCIYRYVWDRVTAGAMKLCKSESVWRQSVETWNKINKSWDGDYKSCVMFCAVNTEHVIWLKHCRISMMPSTLVTSVTLFANTETGLRICLELNLSTVCKILQSRNMPMFVWFLFGVGFVRLRGSNLFLPPSLHHHNHFMALLPGPPGWAGARKLVQGKTNRGRHTNHLAGATPSGLTSAHLHHSNLYSFLRITIPFQHFLLLLIVCRYAWLAKWQNSN